MIIVIYTILVYDSPYKNAIPYLLLGSFFQFCYKSSITEVRQSPKQYDTLSYDLMLSYYILYHEKKQNYNNQIKNLDDRTLLHFPDKFRSLVKFSFTISFTHATCCCHTPIKSGVPNSLPGKSETPPV